MIEYHHQQDKKQFNQYILWCNEEILLFLNEQEHHFNHRYTGKYMIDKVKLYMQKSFPISYKQIVYILNVSTSYFASTVDYGDSRNFFNIFHIF